jgi:hypothetical protein
VKKTQAQALSEGLAQIQARNYAAEIIAAGASPVHAFAVAFDGKTVRVQKLRSSSHIRRAGFAPEAKL